MLIDLTTDTPHHQVYAYTGGKPFDPTQPTVVFIHGVLNDHSVWILQSRHLAHHGWNVLALDLPGHGRSGGDAPASVEQAADAVVRVLDALGIAQAALVGHSWGSLIALEAAAQLQDRATHVVLVNVFSRSTLAPPPSALGPGTWIYGASMALGKRVLASNPMVNVFHRGFVACDSYTNGDSAIAAVQCPLLFLLGTEDQMTHPKAAQGLIRTARSAGKQVEVVSIPVGHHQMTEAPEASLMAIKEFLK